MAERTAAVENAAGSASPTPSDEKAGPESNTPLPDGRDLLAAATEALEANRTVQASIRHETTLLGRRVVGRGVYLEQQDDPWRRVRLELSTQMGQSAGSLVQVCDGRFLWTYDSLAQQPRVEKVDLARVAEVLGQDDLPEGLAGSSHPPIFYGLPKLLEALSRGFVFGRATPGRWGPSREPVWKVEGQWFARQPVRDAAHGSGEGPSAASAAADEGPPPLVPDMVVVLLDQQNLFPLRIKFRWTRDGPLGSGAAVAVDFFDVKLDVPIDPTRFSYSPRNLEVVDETRRVIERLRK